MKLENVQEKAVSFGDSRGPSRVKKTVKVITFAREKQ